MGPHSQYFYYPPGFKNLVNKTVFNINAPRVSAGEIPHEPFVRRRVLEWIGAKNREQAVYTGAKPGGLNLLSVLVSVPRKNELPVYHGGFFEHLARGVFMFLRRDSRMPGVDRR